MINYSEEIKDFVNRIKSAEQIVIYGAKQRAKDIIPVCEAFSEKYKINVAVTKKERGGVKQYFEGYEVHEISEIQIGKNTVLLIAMGEHYFDEIRSMPQVEEAGYVFYLKMPLLVEAKSYAVFSRLKELGIDLRLFDLLYRDDILHRKEFEKVNSIKEKAWELATEETARYVIERMQNAKQLTNRYQYHGWLKEEIKKNQTTDGMNMEFGVADGNTIRQFAGETGNIFYGFDSFEGLPEDWTHGYEKGSFKRNGLPEVPGNVELIAGWFDQTLPLFTARDDVRGKKADFIHIDCDLYTSAKTVFHYIGEFIKEGTLIAFDEYFNYPGWQMHEYKAFQEYVKENHIRYEYLAYTDRDCAVCVRIL